MDEADNKSDSSCFKHDGGAKDIEAPLYPLAIESVSLPRERHSIFSAKQKLWIIGVTTVVGSFSSLSQYIFYPVIAVIAKDLHTTVAHIDLTVTAFLAVEAIAPAVLGDVADTLGRRPVFLACLAAYTGSNIGCALARNWKTLLAWKLLQGAGISSIQSISFGVVADISTSTERGKFISILLAGLCFADTIGPVFGGIIGYFAGWRWIFWFLCILAGTSLTVVFFALPETSRGIVDDGSRRPPTYARLPHPPLIRLQEGKAAYSRESCYIPNPLKNLWILKRKDRGFLVFITGLF